LFASFPALRQPREGGDVMPIGKGNVLIGLRRAATTAVRRALRIAVPPKTLPHPQSVGRNERAPRISASAGPATSGSAGAERLAQEPAPRS
jgi:arginine deiminase